MYDDNNRNYDGTFKLGHRVISADVNTQQQAGINATDSVLSASIKLNALAASKGEGGFGSSGILIGVILQEMNWRNPLHVIGFLLAIGSLVLAYCVGSIFGEIFWIMGILAVGLPLFAYVKTVQAAQRYGAGVKVHFGFGGAIAFALTIIAVYIAALVILEWLLDAAAPGESGLVAIVFNAITGRAVSRHPVLAIIVGVAAIPIGVFIHGWFARRIARGKRAIPWYMRPIVLVVLSPFLLAAALALAGFYFRSHQQEGFVVVGYWLNFLKLIGSR